MEDVYDDKFTSASFDNVSLKIKKSVADKKQERKYAKKMREKRMEFRAKASGAHPYKGEKNHNLHLGQKRKSSKAVISGVLGLALVGVLVFFFVKQNNISLVKQKAALEREMASLAQLGKLILDNFNRYEQKLFINGVETELDLYLTAKIKPGENIVIRVESKNKRPYVHRIAIASGESKRLRIPNQPKEQFGKLRAFGSKCTARTEGTLHFVLYGEKRILPIPFNGLLSFPLRGDGNTSMSQRGFAIYDLIYKSKDGKSRSIEVEFQSISNPINICDLL